LGRHDPTGLNGQFLSAISGTLADMAATGSRTLRLLSLLQAHRYWSGVELAGRLGVSTRTLRRDVDRLRDLGYPVQATRGVDGGYQLAPGAALPPLVVDDDEAVALAVGMQAAANGAVAGIEEAALSALTKVVQVMPPRLRRRVDALRAVTVPASWGEARPALAADVLICLAQACRDGERLEFDYTSRGGERTERHVEPHRLVPLGRRWYLVAYDLGRQDWRRFRLDRLTGPRSTGARFLPRPLPAADAAAFVRAGIDDLSARLMVEAVVQAPAAVVRPRVGWWGAVEALDGESCRVRMAADSLDWAALALGMLGADFTVIAPVELADLLVAWGARLSRAGAPPPHPPPG
jgi:predicted DNA-binding transcriptional regulator YafY